MRFLKNIMPSKEMLICADHKKAFICFVIAFFSFSNLAKFVKIVEKFSEAKSKPRRNRRATHLKQHPYNDLRLFGK